MKAKHWFYSMGKRGKSYGWSYRQTMATFDSGTLPKWAGFALRDGWYGFGYTRPMGEQA